MRLVPTAVALLALSSLPVVARDTVPRKPAAARASALTTTIPQDATCAAKKLLKVRFYRVGQGLSALVNLPDGRNILVDSGPPIAHSLAASLQRDLAGKPIDLFWITHQHIDHIGGADNVMTAVPVKVYADNGRSPTMPEVVKARNAAKKLNAEIKTWGPNITVAPLAATKTVKVEAIVPTKWVTSCKTNENLCSIGLRIQYCQSSILFTGDMENEEEAVVDPKGHATLLQVAHHGSDTSTGPAFLAQVKPKYAVVSAGAPFEGANVRYCLPSKSVMERLTAALGGPGRFSLSSFDGTVLCAAAKPANWVAVKVSDRLFATERDGDLVLVTNGNGSFTVENQQAVNARLLQYMRSLAVPH